MSNWQQAVSVLGAEARCPKCGEDRQIDRHRSYAFCNTCAYRWDPRSYDDRQIEAERITCPVCGRERYATVPHDRCSECR